jgi:hypothetical protein
METVKYDYGHLTEWADLEKQRESIVTMQKVLEDTEKKWRRAELPVKSASTTYKIILNK